MTLTLHYIPGSAAMAPHAALAETGADYTLALVREDGSGRRPVEYRALNPWGQVPTLEDGDLVLTEACAIMLHLADRFPAAGLGAPAGTRARSELYRWLAYLSTAVQQTYMRWFYPERFTTGPRAEAAVRTIAESELRRHARWIDGQLAIRPWVAGGARTGGDIYLFMLTYWGRNLEPPWWDSPNLGGHYARLREQRGVRRMMTEQGLAEPPDRA